MSDIADDGGVSHLLHVLDGDDVAIAGGSHEDVRSGAYFVQSDDLVALHDRLECADGVDFRDQYTTTHTAQSLSTALAHLTITANHANLPGNHHIGGTLDAINEAFAATVGVVELGFGDGVIYVDGGEEELSCGLSLVETVDTGGGLLGTAAADHHATVPVLRVLGKDALEQCLEFSFVLVGIGRAFQYGCVVFSLIAQVHHQRGVAPVVHDGVWSSSIREGECLEGAFPIIL